MAESETDIPFAGEALARFVADSCWQGITPPLRHEAKRSLLNFFGGALGSADAPEIEAAVRVLAPLAGPPQASVIGRHERFDIANAAFVNAATANFLDFDDTHPNTIIHPSACVAAAALAIGEHRGLSGAQVLHAFVLGVDVECRIGNAVSPGHYARGWHITSTCGVFGAAAAATKLLGLGALQTLNALGLAASASAGIIENLPTAGKNVSVGNAARNGILAALLAEAGYTAGPAAIEGRLGWARAMGDVPKLDELTGELGKRFELLRNTYKPYPCGIVLHAVIDACFELRRALGVAASDVAQVTVRGHRLLLDRGDRPVANERDARVSIHHSVAVVFLFGAAGLREYSAPVVTDPEVTLFRQRIRAEVDPAMPIGPATVTVETTDGRSASTTVNYPKGSVENPLTDTELESKARSLAADCNVRELDRLIYIIWRLEMVESVKPLLALAKPDVAESAADC